MALQPGTKLGPYEVLSQIGAGGMGEVYKARDTRLNRDVAIKVLPEHLALNAALRQRFQREAETIANLKHPHICVLHDIGEQPGPFGVTQYLVMEYLEGETLAERLLEGPLPLDQVLRYAIEISDALDKAHRQGATHRDIKPANIMLTKEGTKLLDFGLAKLKQQAAKAPVLLDSDAPTPIPGRPAPAGPTVEGTILGTVQYMAPEQVEGRIDDIDGRTDIFSFGATVYEMLTGKKAFEGKSAPSVMAKILEVDPPPMSSLDPPGKTLPPAMDYVVKTCLAKDRDDRWQSATDLCRELKRIRDGGSQSAALTTTTVVAAPKSSWKRKLAFSAVGTLGLVIAVFAGMKINTPTPQPVSRVTISLPPGQRLAALEQPAIAISPDGKNLVYVAVQDNQSPDRERGANSAADQGPLAYGRGSDSVQMLYLRPLDSNESKPIAGTEGAVSPFFSPDGQWIGFFAGGKLKKVSVNGGAAVTLTSAPNPGGAAWSSQGTLALQPTNAAQSLQQVSQEGGALQPLTRVGGVEPYYRWPEFLPAGKAVLFASTANFVNWNNAQIAVQPAGAGERKNLAQGTQPRYSLTGHLLYAQSGTLMAAPFDAQRLTLTGAAVPALEGVMQTNSTGAAQYSVSSTGTLIYLAGGIAGDQSRLVWVSRNGEEQSLPAALHNYQLPRVSPDGLRVAVGIAEQESQVWVYDLSRDTVTRLTFEGNNNSVPAWTPDGKRIAFYSNRAGSLNLFWQPSDGSGAAERLTTSDYQHTLNSFSPDGQLLAFQEANPQTGRDFWVLRLSDRKAQPFLKTPYEDAAPRFSPDGKWLAYSSDESGRREIYVQPYPGPGGKWQISTDGGQEPVWNPKGGELFYRSGSKIMAVDVNTKAGFSAGKPRMLFDGPYVPTAGSLPAYDVSPDGQRFLMLKPV
ncbi:MAG: PD40 domain-containing protein, partial [Acidobacteria bacterium]|nr:PD40 domain-containing protein [Acidobacteriota bacterium]